MIWCSLPRFADKAKDSGPKEGNSVMTKLCKVRGNEFEAKGKKMTCSQVCSQLYKTSYRVRKKKEQAFAQFAIDVSVIQGIMVKEK